MATRSWNRVELMGNLTRDPELRYTPSGAAVCTFSIATNRVFVIDGERKEEADFHRCVAWNKLAELCNQLLKKGYRVFVSGRLQNRSWEDANKQQRQTTEVVIEEMLLISSPRGATSASEGTASEDVSAVDATEEKATPPAKPASTKTTAKEEESTPTPTESGPTPTEEVGDDLPF